jgi:hypothetical protein
MSNFQHFLITRINIDWHISKPKTREERNDPDFLKHRLDIFEKICYPSVKAQINKNFIWLLLVDSDLPDLFRKRIEKYSLSTKIIPVYITDKETCLDSLKQVIKENFSLSNQYLITTNLDSDDAIAEDFILTIQEQFKNQNFEFINFPFGYLYRFQDKTLYLREWLTAPCHTLIETFEDWKTVLTYPHATITQYKVSQIFMKPMWLMTSHGKNVRTSYDVSAAWQPLNRLDNSFKIKLEIPQQHILTTYKEMFSNVLKVINSKKSWDIFKVKLLNLEKLWVFCHLP